jgi:hypothetical protein
MNGRAVREDVKSGRQSSLPEPIVMIPELRSCAKPTPKYKPMRTGHDVQVSKASRTRTSKPLPEKKKSRQVSRARTASALTPCRRRRNQARLPEFGVQTHGYSAENKRTRVWGTKVQRRRFGKTIEDKNDVCPCCVVMTKCGHTQKAHCRRQSGRMESALPAHCCFMRGKYK